MTSADTYAKLCAYESGMVYNTVPKTVESPAPSSDVYSVEGGKIKKQKKGSLKKTSSQSTDRRFMLISYLPLDFIKEYLEYGQPWIHHWAYCYHDKDCYSPEDEQKNPDNKAGTTKKPHTHILLYTYNRKSSSAVAKIFNRLALDLVEGDAPIEKTMCIFMDDPALRWRYLLHLDERDSCYYHYPQSCRHCDDWQYWSRLESNAGMTDSAENKAAAMIDDYIAGVSYRTMVNRYGHYFLMNAGKVRDLGNRICIEESRPIPHMSAPGDTLPEDIVRMMVEGSRFDQFQQASFFLVWAYLQHECFTHYGSPLNFYLKEGYNEC